MFKRLFPVLAGLMLLAPSLAVARPAEAAPATVHRVVFDMTSPQPSNWKALMDNVANLEKRFGAKNTEIEVVCHGPGLALLYKGNQIDAARLAGLVKTGVVFDACHNAMNHFHVTKADLFPFVHVVPSGVGRIVLREEEGWSYLKVVL